MKKKTIDHDKNLTHVLLTGLTLLGGMTFESPRLRNPRFGASCDLQ